jgi:hypothetical protein
MTVQVVGEPDAIRAALTGLLANRNGDFYGIPASVIEGDKPDSPNSTRPRLWLMAAPHYCETPEEVTEWQAKNPNCFAAGAAWRPHWSLWGRISREYPTVTFAVGWRVEGLWDSGVAEVRDGRVEITDRQRGYFVSPPPHGLTHHYALDIAPNTESARAALAGLILPYRTEHEPYHHDAVTRHPDRVRERLAELGYSAADEVPDDYDGPVYRFIPYGLDRDIHLDTIDTDARLLIGEEFDGFAANDRLPLPPQPSFQAKLDVALRSITLESAEVDTLRAIMVGQPRYLPERPTSEESARFFADTFTAVERTLINNAILGSVPLRPTHRMIGHLLATESISPERRDELQAALDSPAWAGEDGRWPEWEMQAAKHVHSSVS